MEQALQKKVDSRLPGTILKGTIVSQIGNDVIVEVGLKSEGIVDAGDFDSPDEIVQGKEIEVLLEDTDSESGLVLLNKRKADIIKGWERILETKKEGDVVRGKVIGDDPGGSVWMYSKLAGSHDTCACCSKASAGELSKAMVTTT